MSAALLIQWTGMVGLMALGAFFVLPAGWILRTYLREHGSGRVPCLLYHQLQPAELRGSNEIDPIYVCFEDRFREQMNYLHAAGYTTLSLPQLLEGLERPASLPPRPVVVTFDDGFASNHAIGLPILQANGQQATVFMTPDRASSNFAKYARLDRPLSDDQLRELSGNGIDIQSHGLTHRFLSDLNDAALRHELESSREAIVAVTGRPVLYLAIPGGAYNRRVRQFAREAGYEAIFCMSKGSAGPEVDRWALPRMVVSGTMTLDDFRGLLSPAGCFRGRMISVVQEGLGRTLGMRRLDALRRWLYASPLRSLMRPAILAWVLPVSLLIILGAIIFGLIV